MESGLHTITKLELYKELDALNTEDFYAVVDTRVKNHLPKWIQFSPQVFWLAQPEEQKNLETFKHATDFFLSLGINRSSTLLVMGGGATTDLGGFVAATLLRGIRWRAVPTTLLAMIDGSLGGKVAVNTSQGKNLLGAFHLPEEVYLCPELLRTLDEEYWHSGKGELLKYGFLSEEIQKLILSKADLGKIIEACARFKMSIVEKDLQETGLRTQLNLGHTLGHAFESQLKIPHGLAVAMGMKYLFEIFGHEKALMNWKLLAENLSLPIEKLSIRAYPQFNKKDFLTYLEHDKKRVGDKLKLVLVEEPGKILIEEHSFTELKSRINAHADFED